MNFHECFLLFTRWPSNTGTLYKKVFAPGFPLISYNDLQSSNIFDLDINQ